MHLVLAGVRQCSLGVVERFPARLRPGKEDVGQVDERTRRL